MQFYPEKRKTSIVLPIHKPGKHPREATSLQANIAAQHNGKSLRQNFTQENHELSRRKQQNYRITVWVHKTQKRRFTFGKSG